MTDETPATPLGTPALHRAVAGVRAGAGAASRIAPAPPPDQVETPWAQHREPRPQTHDDERKAAAVAAVTSPPPVRQPKTKNAKAGKSADDGYELVDAFLNEWEKNVTKHNIGFANGRLARRLMRNGALLIKDQYEIDKLAALIRLGNELVKNTIDEGDEDKRIDEIRQKALARADMHGTVPENANAGEDEPPGEDEENAD
jgi:hypothetical protein